MGCGPSVPRGRDSVPQHRDYESVRHRSGSKEFVRVRDVSDSAPPSSSRDAQRQCQVRPHRRKAHGKRNAGKEAAEKKAIGEDKVADEEKGVEDELPDDAVQFRV